MEVGSVALGVEAGKQEGVQRNVILRLLLDVARPNVVVRKTSKQRVLDNGSDQEVAKTAWISVGRSRAEVTVRIDAGKQWVMRLRAYAIQAVADMRKAIQVPRLV